jgi:hypothetical protein
MSDDLIATGFEADAGLKRIEIAVERVAQGDGDTHRQNAGGLVSFGTSLGHDRPPRAVDSAKTEVKWDRLTEEFIQKIFFVNIKWATGQISWASVRNPQRGPRVVSDPEWVVTTQRSSAMRQKRGGNSEVAGLSETVWGQGA